VPEIERHGPIEAWIIDDTGFPKKGRHSVGVLGFCTSDLAITTFCWLPRESSILPGFSRRCLAPARTWRAEAPPRIQTGQEAARLCPLAFLVQSASVQAWARGLDGSVTRILVAIATTETLLLSSYLAR
jgi:hypothetical protein